MPRFKKPLNLRQCRGYMFHCDLREKAFLLFGEDADRHDENGMLIRLCKHATFLGFRTLSELGGGDHLLVKLIKRNVNGTWLAKSIELLN